MRRYRSRSRSRSPRRRHYRSSSRRSSRSYRRSQSRSRGGSRSRSRSLSRQKERSPGIHGSTNIQDLELMKARVFIGNLPFDKVTKEELENMFAKYGKILGISTHERGFGFIQFSKEEEGLEAVKNEDGGLLKGHKLDVKMALEGRRGGGKPPQRGNPRGASPGPYPDRFAPPPGSRDGHPPATEDRYPPPAGGRRPPPGVPPAEGRERSPLRGDPYEDRYRDPYREPGPPPPPRRDDPYYADPYRRPPPDDPYFDRYRDDPYRYRRDPYGDPYRDPYYRDYYDAPRKPPPPPDVEVILLNAKLKGYGEFVERKLSTKSMTTLVTVIPEDRTIPQMIEEASKRGHLFAIVINSQNEVHQSLTLNILHGTPQEHRNMPIEDAITLVGRSFETYMQTTREKAAPPVAAPPPERGAAPAPPAARAPPPFVPPGPDISYLLNLLADNRQLTIEELDKVIGYLRERRDKLYENEGRRLPEAGYGVGDLRKEDNNLQQQQQELQAKILSILNGPGDSGVSQAPKPSPGMGNGAPLGGGGQPGMSSLINFDNPHVQKALDNLIQSGPNLLKNISSTPGIKPVSAGLMSREGEPMRRDGLGGGYGSMPGNAPMQAMRGQGGPGGQQPAQRPMYGSGPGGAPPRPGGPGQIRY